MENLPDLYRMEKFGIIKLFKKVLTNKENL